MENNIVGGVSDSPLLLFQPLNIIVFISFFSPIILALGVSSLSFIFQNFKGLIYLGYLIGSCLIRSYIYILNGGEPIKNDRTICSSIQFSKYGNPTFSAFVFAFTIMYLSLPMFINKNINFWVLISLLIYFLIDIFLKISKKCIVSTGELFLNILLGMTTATLFIILMYIGGSSKYLFFNEISSNKEICYQPKEQTFRCSVYKNGELISNL
jgi:hypothetical protein